MHRPFQCLHYSSIKPSALSSAFRHQLLTAWSRSLWGWTASCQEGCPPLWPSTLWPTRYSVMTLQYIGAPTSLSLWTTVTKMLRVVGPKLTNSCFKWSVGLMPVGFRFFEIRKPKSGNNLFPLFFFLFFPVKTENDKKKEDLFLWCVSKQNLATEIRASKLVSRFCAAFFFFLLWPRNYGNAAIRYKSEELIDQRLIWSATSNLRSLWKQPVFAGKLVFFIAEKGLNGKSCGDIAAAFRAHFRTTSGVLERKVWRVISVVPQQKTYRYFKKMHALITFFIYI